MAKKNDDVDAQIKDLLSAQRLAPDLETFAVACMNEWGVQRGWQQRSRGLRQLQFIKHTLADSSIGC